MYKPLLYLGNLEGPEGNAFCILGRARKVALENDMDWAAIQKEATSGDYENLLETMRTYFDAQVDEQVITRSL